MSSVQKCILVVDDEFHLVEIVCEYLTDLGYKTLSAYDGEQGLERVQNNDVDVVISDVNMPKLSGLEMLKNMREAGIRTPVIFFTAFADTANIQEALKLGAFDFQEKPIDFEIMTSLITNAIAFGAINSTEVP